MRENETAGQLLLLLVYLVLVAHPSFSNSNTVYNESLFALCRHSSLRSMHIVTLLFLPINNVSALYEL